MLLPVAAALGALTRPFEIPVVASLARSVKLRTVFTPLAGAVEFWPVKIARAIARRTRVAFRAIGIGPALLPRLGFATGRTIAEISARATIPGGALAIPVVALAIPAVAVAIPATIPAVALAIRRASREFLVAAELSLRPIATSRRTVAKCPLAPWPLTALAKTFAAWRVGALFTITVPRCVGLLIAELPVGKSRCRAGVVATGARRARGIRTLFTAAIVAVKLRPVAARLVGAFLSVAGTRGTIGKRPIAARAFVTAKARLVG